MKFVMRKLLEERNIKNLFHFTQYGNLDSIIRHGLVRRTELARREIDYRFCDDKRLDGYPQTISLSIGFPNYRMFYSARQRLGSEQWVVLAVSPQVLLDKPCAFFPQNAASGEYKDAALGELLGTNALEALFQDVGGKTRAELKIPQHFPTDPQAEVLVFDDVEVDYLNFIYTQYTHQTKEILANYPQIDKSKVACVPDYFLPRMDYAHWS